MRFRAPEFAESIHTILASRVLGGFGPRSEDRPANNCGNAKRKDERPSASDEEPMTDRLPPNNPEAEKVLLGSILRKSDLIDEIATAVKPSDFYSHANGLIFDAATRLHQSGKPANVVAIFDYFRAAGNLDDIGGHAYLADLHDDQWSSKGVEHFARIIRDQAIRRQILRAVNGLQAAAFEAEDAAEALETVEATLQAIGDDGNTADTAVDMPAIIARTTELIDRRQQRHREGKITGIESPWFLFDQYVGGFQAGELGVIAARTSIGKTAFALNIAKFALELNRSVFITSLEMPAEDLACRFLGMVSRVASRRFKIGDFDDKEQKAVHVAMDSIRPWNLRIDDRPGQTVSHVASVARRIQRRHGLDLIVIDYLGLLTSEDRKPPKHEQIAEMTRRLKNLAKELQIPVLVLVQLNRAATEAEEPKLSHLRDSGAIEQDADTVILLHREAEDDHAEPICVHVAKNRGGPCGRIGFTMRKPFYLFEETAQ